jgi:PAS domain S-box-containing protein
MELWIAALTKERARFLPDPGEARDRLAWARTFVQHAMIELERGAEMPGTTLLELSQLDAALDSAVSAYLDTTDPDRRRQLDVEIETALQRLEAVIEPEERQRDQAMDQAGQEILSLVKRWQLYLILVTGFGFLAALGLAWWLSRRLTAPLRRLAEFSRQVGAGELPPQLGPQSTGEIGDLAHSFEEMAQRLDRSRRELIDSEQRYRALFAHARHGIAILAPDRTIVEVNDALVQLVQRPAAELLDQPLAILFGSESRAGLESGLRQMLSPRHPSVELALKNGDEVLQIEASGVEMPDGRTVMVLRDTREQRRIEQALIQGEKLGAIGQLAAGVAHELRNPLFVISNVIYDLRETLQADGDLARSLDIADQENQRARKIIDNLLEFSRKGGPGERSLELDAAIRQVAMLFRKALQEHGIELSLALGPTPPCGFEPDGFKQVLVNLISNAIDAMPQGGRLTIETGSTPDGRIDLRVADTGEGINQELQRQIFNPFFSTKAPGSGTGLGLWIVHSTVTRNHGQIEIQSEPGVGTTFHLRLDQAAEPFA